MKIYLVFQNHFCESEETCSCHWNSLGTLDKAFKNKKEAEKYTKESYRCHIEEIELE